MSLISNGIDKVRVCELPAGVRPGGECFSCTRFALVRWRSQWSDKFYQVYVNGKFCGTTLDVEQRQLIISVPGSFASAVRVEVFAIEPQFARIDYSDELFLADETSRVKLRLVRSQSLPLGSVIQIYSDNGSGTIDYGNPVSIEPLRVWPSFYDKAGFGMCEFGKSDFGFDSAAAVGFAMGNFGYGQFGLDADVIEWTSEPLSKGIYKFAAKIIDKNGCQSDAVETGPIAVIDTAIPAAELDISSYDTQTNKLTLSIN
jgi:hypothetical protein